MKIDKEQPKLNITFEEGTDILVVTLIYPDGKEYTAKKEIDGDLIEDITEEKLEVLTQDVIKLMDQLEQQRENDKEPS